MKRFGLFAFFIFFFIIFSIVAICPANAAVCDPDNKATAPCVTKDVVNECLANQLGTTKLDKDLKNIIACLKSDDGTQYVWKALSVQHSPKCTFVMQQAGSGYYSADPDLSMNNQVWPTVGGPLKASYNLHPSGAYPSGAYPANVSFHAYLTGCAPNHTYSTTQVVSGSSCPGAVAAGNPVTTDANGYVSWHGGTGGLMGPCTITWDILDDNGQTFLRSVYFVQ